MKTISPWMPLLLLCLPGRPAPAVAAPATPPLSQAYAGPGEKVEIAPGRALNLRCTGSGPRTVLLEAGANADSSTWYRVQALLPATVRACAYDRAGYGYSDEGPLPRDLEADVADLAALVAAAGLDTPLVLVGHSLGSNIVRRYAQLHPRQVAGLVLVDPPPQGADALMPAAWHSQDQAARAGRTAFLDACLAAAADGSLDRATGAQASCLRAPPPWQDAGVAAALRARKLQPAYWRTLRSELEANATLFAAPVAPDEDLGDLPLVLLAAPPQPVDEQTPPDVARTLEQARTQTQARLLASSSNSRRVDLADTSHDVQLDQPQAVVAAIEAVLARPATSADAPAR